MKKILFIAAIAALACACGNKAATTEEAAAEDSVAVEACCTEKACCAEKAECCGKCEEAAACCEEEAKKTLGEVVAEKAVEKGAPEEVKEVTAAAVDAAAAKAVDALKK